MSNSLDPDQGQHFVGPDLGPNCLQSLSERVKGYSRKKYLGGGGGGGGGGKTAGDIFFYGLLVRKVFKLYGSLVFDQI